MCSKAIQVAKSVFPGPILVPMPYVWHPRQRFFLYLELWADMLIWSNIFEGSNFWPKLKGLSTALGKSITDIGSDSCLYYKRRLYSCRWMAIETPDKQHCLSHYSASEMTPQCEQINRQDKAFPFNFFFFAAVLASRLFAASNRSTSSFLHDYFKHSRYNPLLMSLFLKISTFWEF